MTPKGSVAAGATMGIVSNAVELCGSVTTMVPVTTAVPAAAGITKMRVGLIPRLPIPASVQPDVPRQFELPAVDVSVSNHAGIVLNEFDMIESYAKA